MKKVLIFLFLAAGVCPAWSKTLPGDAGDDAWPVPTAEMKPWVYNWWMGSAVDATGLEHQCAELAAKGFGGFHVIPIYGAKGGYEKKWRELLSPEWIEAWNLAVRTARKHGLGVDLTMGSGWCFGGPWVSTNDAASSLMRVKRAGPGGAGFMIDPFSPSAMSNHIARFEAAFGKGGTAERPRAFYHDSYEYFKAKPKHGEDVDDAQLACFKVWTDWCRANGYLTRNEGHGAPCNWLDFYALADVPETEMFGKTDRDILLSKFASSAAHVKGTRLVSAESCTWLDEHFCERPDEIKRFLDRLFLAGVNHVFYHGLCYSPVEAVWPGWSFYASLEMNPRNPIWREIGALSAYVTRCQSLFQTWESDNDLALVWDPTPFRKRQAGDPAPQMSIHRNDWFYGEKIGRLAKRLYAEGYCFDYVSPRQLKTVDLSRYAEIVDPEKNELPRVARRERFEDAPGLLFTRWRKGAERQYFLVNDGADELLVTSTVGAFTVLDPLDGSIRRVTAATLKPGHSLFARGPVGFCRVTRATMSSARTATSVVGPWRLKGVCGGPVVPTETNLATLVGWETFDPAFSGTMRYETTFSCGASGELTLDLGDVREMAHTWINGRDLGVRFMKPYAFAVPKGLLRPSDNRLVVEVTNLGANRLRWNDLNGICWKYFTDANVLSPNYKKLDASTWTPKVSGLLGPVRIRTAEKLSGDQTWEANPLTWRFDAVAGGFRASGSGGFAVAGTTNYACARVSARITPGRTGTNEWSTLGVSVFEDDRNFWHAALVQAPSDVAGGKRFFELVEMRNGHWLAERADKLKATRAFDGGTWHPGASYVVSIACTPEGVSARACDEKGKLLWERGYSFTRTTDGQPAKAVTCGRPALRTTGCFRGTFADISQACSDPCACLRERNFPPYASDSFVPGVTDRATGFFRMTEKDGRWWVIDPLGRGTVLLGIDHVTYYGHYSQRAKRGYYREFNRARFPNKADWEADTLGRLKAWGFNALGAGCDPDLEHRGLVHTRFLSLGDALCRTSWQGADTDLFICPNEHRPCSAFPNVFHPSFPDWADYVARRKCAPNRTDPWLFGYFIDNELAWWGRGAQNTGLFEAVARLPEGHSAKAAQRRFLAERGVTGKVPDAVKLDFLKLAAERYFGVSCAAIRRHDPNHLILGARFAGLGGAHPVVWEASAKDCDVVTFNCYPWADLDRNVMLTSRGGSAQRITDAFSELYGRVRRPMLVTEWSFPALDSGLPCTGGAGQRFRTQALRTQATELFARTMLSLPFLVGYDYFMWVDQPPEGISDEFPENSNYGLINEKGVAYPEITSMFARLHAHLGTVRASGLPPERTGIAPVGETARQFLGRAGRTGTASYVRTGDRYVIRNAAGLELAGRVGGWRIFESVKLNGRPLGGYTGMWSELRNESQSWNDAGKVISAEWREEDGRGVLRVTCEGRPTPTHAVRQTHDLTVFADRSWFLCDLVSLANAGTDPVEVKEFYFRQYPSFALEDDSRAAKKSVPNLWKATACDRWLSQSGDAYYGGYSFAQTVTQFRYWLMNGKSRHPDAAFAPDARLVLQPGAVYDPKGRIWMLALCGLDGERGWSDAVRELNVR